MPIIVDRLTKRFGDKTVFENLSFTLPEQGVVFVSGRSGSGKTTLLSLLMGLQTPDSGHISGLAGKRFTAVFQENRLLEGRSVYRNIRLFCPRSLPDADISAHLNEVGLSGEEHTPARLLSGGMQRRVALVRALIVPGDILVLDEPFKGLDELTKAQALDYVRRHIQNRLVLLVTHDVREADALGVVQTLVIGE